MADTSQQLQFLITAQEDVSKKLADISGALEKTQKSTKDLEESFGRFGEGLNDIKNKVLAAFSVESIIKFAETAVDAASEQQEADDKLANALSNVAGARQTDFDMLTAQAGQLQTVTRFSDEQIQATQALALGYGMTAKQVATLTPNILNMTEHFSALGDKELNTEGVTRLLGKAVEGNVTMLQRYGVQLTEAEKAAVEHGDQAERLSVINEVLAQKFNGAAVAAGETFAGRVTIAKNAVNDLMEGVGKALIPSLESLLGIVTSNSQGMKMNKDTIDAWGKALYQVTNGLMFLVDIVSFVIKAVYFLGQTVGNFAAFTLASVQDLWGAFKNLGSIISDIAHSMMQAATGDFSGAWDTLKKVVTDNTSHMSAMVRVMASDTMAGMEGLNKSMDGAAKHMATAWSGEGFKPVADAAVKMGNDVRKPIDDIGKASNSTGATLQDLKDKYKDLKDKGVLALAELKDENVKNMKSIEESIQKTQKSLADLQRQYNEQKKSDTSSIADEVVANQKKIEDLKKQLGPSNDAAMKAELAEREKAVTANEKKIQDIKATAISDNNAMVAKALTDELTDRSNKMIDNNTKISTLKATLSSNASLDERKAAGASLSILQTEEAANEARIIEVKKALRADNIAEQKKEVSLQLAQAMEQQKANEEKIADLKQSITAAANDESRAAIQKELDQRVAAQSNSAGFISSIQTEVTEAQRRANLTDLERAIEDFKSKRALADQEYAAKQSDLNKELQGFQAKEATEKMLYDQKTAYIKKMMADAAKDYEADLKAKGKLTETYIKAEIKLYDDLAAAIAKARSAASSGVLNTEKASNAKSVKDAIISPNGDIITTDPADYLIATKDPKSLAAAQRREEATIVVNISGNSFIGDDDLADRVEKQLMKTLKANVRLA